MGNNNWGSAPASYNQGWQNRGGQQLANAPQRPKSGCKMVHKNGKNYLSAWKKTKFGFLSILVAKSKWTELKTGNYKSGDIKKVLTSLLIKITDKNTGVSIFHFGISDASMSTVKVNGLGWVISTKNGGYVSTRPGMKRKY